MLGYLLTQVVNITLARILSWLLVIAGTSGIDWSTASQPPGFRMLLIIAVLLYTMKVVVAVEVRPTGRANLNFLQWISFAAFWVGMRPALFADLPRHSRDQVQSYLGRGLRNIGSGLALVILSRVYWSVTQDGANTVRLFVTTTLLLPGLSLIVHFGAFHLLTAFWRQQGVECVSVFREPLKSNSLNEFWGKRWNLAFSEMTTLAIFRPMRRRTGQLPAMLTAFLFSGLLHELAISAPVRSGFGGPMLYFLLHGLAMLLESRWTTLANAFATHHWLGRLWTMTWLLLPLPMLFHQPFLRGCVWPLIGITL